MRGSKPGERRGGRQKGTPNKVTVALKGSILGAFEDVGGQDYLRKVATEDPKAFLALLGKLLPSELKVEGAADDGAHIHRIERAVVYPKLAPPVPALPAPKAEEPL